MKIAILSDIHGNYDAFSAVLNEAKHRNVKHLLILGDIVGYYYYPHKILEALSEWSYDIVKGNHEYILEDLMNFPVKKEAIRLKYGSGHQEAIKKLSKEQLSFLRKIPETKIVNFKGVSFLMSHGSPWKNDFYIYPDCDIETILRCDSKTEDFVLIGHSHYSFTVKNENSILLNPGSVGQSREKGGSAFWTIVNTNNKSFQMISTSYNTKNLLREIAVKDPDIEYLKNILNRK